MRSNVRMNRITIGVASLLLFSLSSIWLRPARAQSQNRQQDIQQLKDKLDQLEQTMSEVKAQINALETAPAAAPAQGQPRGKRRLSRQSPWSPFPQRQ